MTKREAVALLKRARAAANQRIKNDASSGGIYAKGLSGEGYAGGYLHAIDDALLLLESDTIPDRGFFRGETW